jgi:propionyl-CoA synthetase
MARTSDYEGVYARAQGDPEGFWAEAAEAIHWERRWDRGFDDSRPPFYRWFPDGRLNVAANCLDRHVASGRGEQLALIYDSPMAGTVERFTYRQLTERVAKFAGGLSSLGVEKGDRVLLYMPMVPEAVVAMQACARLGAVHSVVFGGFAANELAVRIDDAVARADFSSAPVPDFAAVSPDPHRVLADLASRSQIGESARARLREALADLDQALNVGQSVKAGR